MNFNITTVRMKENGTEFLERQMRSTPIAMVAPELKQNAELDTEIKQTCAVLGCDDFKSLSSEEFFRFPEDPHLREIWTNLTGRNNWTPTDYSLICIQHFSVDCFTCDDDDQMVLIDKAVPSLKLPKHVLEVEYIEEDTLDNDDEEYYERDGDTDYEGDDEAKPKPSLPRPETGSINGHSQPKKSSADNEQLLKLFTEVQMMQKQAISLKDKLKYNVKVQNRQTRALKRLNHVIEMKKDVLNQKRKRKARILLSLQDKIKEDTSGLVMAMPTKHTDDLKNFALSIYKYSPQSYIYIRNTLRTMLPSTEILDSWINAGYQPKNVISSSNLIKVTTEQTESELTCKISLR